MKDLSEAKPKPIESASAKMKEDLIASYLRRLKGWKLDNNKIVKEYEFVDDDKAFTFVTRTGKLAVKEGHHPTLKWTYNKVKIIFYTHSVDGLTRNDFIMAAKFDEVWHAMRKEAGFPD